MLGSFTLETAEEYVRHLNARGNRHTGRELSSHTVDAHARALKVFAGFLHDRGKAEVNVLDRLRRPRVRTPRIDVLTDDEVPQLLAAAVSTDAPTGFRNYSIVATFLDTGLRVSELAGLRFEDARLEEGYLDVIGKGDRPRRVPISLKVSDLLLRYRDRVRPQTVPHPDDRFFLSEDGDALTPNALVLELRRRKRRRSRKRAPAGDEIAQAARQKLVEGIQLRWREVLAIEMVLQEVAADFDGEDRALPKQRQALADIKDRLAELGERTQKYAGSFKLGEPDDELPSMVSGVMRQQKEGYE